VVAALKGLVEERTKTASSIRMASTRRADLNVAGLSLAADATNSVIAVGPVAKIRTVEELIGLRTHPRDCGAARARCRRSRSRWGPTKARSTLYANTDPKHKPLVLPMASGGTHNRGRGKGWRRPRHSWERPAQAGQAAGASGAAGLDAAPRPSAAVDRGAASVC
jgi:hypothetical protein